MKKIFFISLLAFSTVYLTAQENPLDTSSIHSIIKFSPISTVNITAPTILFGYEHKIAANKTLQYELGFLTWNNYTDLFLSNRSISYRVNVEHRWYRSEFQRNKKNKYRAVGFRFQQRIDENQEFNIEFDDYISTLHLDNINTSAGFYYAKGFQQVFKNSVTFDFGGALGVQYYNVGTSKTPETNQNIIDVRNTRYYAIQPGHYAFPMAFVVLKLGLIAK
jgi:hypothetical protein